MRSKRKQVFHHESKPSYRDLLSPEVRAKLKQRVQKAREENEVKR